MNKKRLLPIFFLFLLILAFVPQVSAQLVENLLEEGILPIYEANQRGIDFIFALILFLGLVKFALATKWDEETKGFKFVWIPISVALAVGFSIAEQQMGFTIGSIFVEFALVSIAVLLAFLVYRLVKGGENKHTLLLFSAGYLFIYNLLKKLAPTLLNALSGTLFDILSILEVVFIITFIVGLTGFISGLKFPGIKKEEGTLGGEKEGILAKTAKGAWDAVSKGWSEKKIKAQKETKEVMDAIYGTLDKDIKDGEHARDSLVKLRNQVAGISQITDEVGNSISIHLTNVISYFDNTYDSKIRTDEGLLNSLQNTLNQEIDRWRGNDFRNFVKNLIKQVKPGERERSAVSKASNFINAYSASAVRKLQEGIDLVNADLATLGEIRDLKTNTLMPTLERARMDLISKQAFVDSIDTSVRTINEINNKFKSIATSMEQIEKNIKKEFVTDEALIVKIKEFIA